MKKEKIIDFDELKKEERENLLEDISSPTYFNNFKYYFIYFK